MTGAVSVCISVMLVTICLSVGTRADAQAKTTLGNLNASNPASGFRCIVCDDLTNQFCEPWDHFSHSVDCTKDKRIDPSRPIGCRKMVQTILDKTYVSRQCTNIVDSSYQGCIDRVGTKKIKVLYCHCLTPECNSAGRFVASPLLALFLAPFLLAAGVR